MVRWCVRAVWWAGLGRACRDPCPPRRTQVVPNVILTRSVDGSTGTATFKFAKAASVLALDSVWEHGLITGLWLRDEEGTVPLRDG